MDALVADCHADVDWRPLISQLAGEDTYQGHAGIRRWWRRVQDVWSDVENRIDAIVENGDFVYVEGRIEVREAPGVLQPVGWVVEFRGEKVARMEVFQDRARAHAQAGLDQ